MDALIQLIKDQADREHPGRVEIWQAIRDCDATNPAFVRSALVTAIEAIDQHERTMNNLLRYI